MSPKVTADILWATSRVLCCDMHNGRKREADAVQGV